MKQNKKIRRGKYTPHFCLVDIIKNANYIMKNLILK